jgi:translation initiation factor IF-3
VADQFELDLVEISPNAEPQFGKSWITKKFVYEQRNIKDLKRNLQVVVKKFVLFLKQMT